MVSANSLYGPIDPAADAGYVDAPPRMGFFTDTSVCIGCKACEVACKEWNAVPDGGFDLLGTSYDNTGGLTANSWRHVAFIEQSGGCSSAGGGCSSGGRSSEGGHSEGWSSAGGHSRGGYSGGGSSAGGHSGGGQPGCGCSGSAQASAVGSQTVPDTGTAPGIGPAIDALAAAGVSDLAPDVSAGTGSAQFLGMPGSDLPGRTADAPRSDFRWLMMSNVCKHCTHAGCLDVCPTGALFRTEFGTVVVQEDICNGCGYCVPACPYGVIDRREDDGRAWKCTLCYDRIGDGLMPACAAACPTQSIQYGELDELRARAAHRVEKLHDQGVTEARLYGHDPADGVGGDGAFFLLLDEPEVYGLPPDPVVTTRDLPAMWKRAGLAALAMAGAAAVSFLGSRS